MYGLLIYIYHRNKQNVGKLNIYIYMDAMGGRKDAIANVLQLGFMRLIHLNLTIDPTH